MAQQLHGNAAAVLDDADGPVARPPENFTADAPDVDGHERLAHAVSLVGSRLGNLSVNIADTSGTVGDVARDLAAEAEAFHELTGSLRQIADTSADAASVAREAVGSAASVRDGLSDTATSIENAMSVAIRDIQDMARSSNEVSGEFDAVVGQLSEVYGFSESIKDIATETQMLAINAGIMAAHAGDAGRGFAVVAESVRQLAGQTERVSRDIITRLEKLSASVEVLQKQNRSNSEKAAAAVERSGTIDADLRKFHVFGENVATMTNEISGISEPVERANRICVDVLDKVTVLDSMAQENAAKLANTSEKFDHLVSFSEDMVLLVEESGIETEDTPVIRACIAAAQETARLFEQAVDSGGISMPALFDERYRPVAGTDPQQVLTAFTEFTDRVMPPIQEAFLDVDPRVVFCAAVDRNGYLPTHNHKYSRPQSDDQVWNAANCRNRRIFDDRTGLAAGRNTKSFLLQTYRRDMGGGQYQLMKDLSSPVFVKGRHWGGLRVGFSTKQKR
ncbi:methyl-accepting chemotaxis protein [Oricola nitratireducens]|uniref:methyl-accepting chemotaxis protein n=1 Tax=Oricola nitratireducens TaxID=2775868 RepID=UPI001868B5F9|nr:methyl-accepting chemotaxis protein [Oricola nitratireducens]